MKLWMLHSALRVAMNDIRFPRVRVMSSSWSDEDHAHFCYALRVLETKDFLAVCPLCKQKGKPCFEHEDECDRCPYFGGVDFIEENGAKRVKFWELNS